MTEQDAADAETGTDDGDAAVDGSPEETTTDEATDSTDAPEERGREVDEDLVDRVAESDPADVARELAALRSRVDDLEAELDDREETVADLESKLKRKQADFQNFKKRMEQRQEEERQRATEDLVSRMLDVRDNLVRALDQDEDVDIRDGVESTRRQFDDVLAAENVDVLDPEPGAEVDPQYHQVLATVESDQPEGTIDEVHRPGYVMADKVLREAQITVSDGSGDGEGGDEGDTDGDDGAEAPEDDAE